MYGGAAPVGALIVPSAQHRLDAPRYKERYAAAKVYAPRGSRRKVEEQVAVDGSYEDFPKDAAVSLETLRGVAEAEGAMLVRSQDGVTVVLNDVVMHMDRKKDPLAWFFTTLLGSAGSPRVSRLMKLAVVKDQAAPRRDLERLAALPDLVRLVVSHEKMESGRPAAEALREAAGTLRG